MLCVPSSGAGLRGDYAEMCPGFVRGARLEQAPGDHFHHQDRPWVMLFCLGRDFCHEARVQMCHQHSMSPRPPVPYQPQRQGHLLLGELGVFLRALPNGDNETKDTAGGLQGLLLFSSKSSPFLFKAGFFCFFFFLHSFLRASVMV